MIYNNNKILTVQKIIKSAKSYHKRIGNLKARVMYHIATQGISTAQEIDKNIGYSAGRRANDLTKIEILEVKKREKCEKIGERFYYQLSPLGKNIIKTIKK